VHANEHRNWRVYADLAQVPIGIARPLYGDEPFGIELGQTVLHGMQRPLA
jgi:hypothetical protein